MRCEDSSGGILHACIAEQSTTRNEWYFENNKEASGKKPATVCTRLLAIH